MFNAVSKDQLPTRMSFRIVVILLEIPDQCATCVARVSKRLKHAFRVRYFNANLKSRLPEDSSAELHRKFVERILRASRHLWHCGKTFAQQLRCLGIPHL